jgi:predicted O-linked N-acetylglucosamine transferase (SPINDLY family)
MPERLVFARHAPIPEYLARLAAADLFLDTFPYNAGATANDALWAGLPVLTCAGNSYVGRMAGSLLHAVGLPELVTASPAEYEARALELARDPARLRELRRRLADNRAGMPLFDMARYTSDIEAACTGMWQRWRAGEPPAAFRVAADVNRFS